MKHLLTSLAVAAVFVVVARYVLFPDKTEFAQFFYVLKTFVAPVLIVIALAFMSALAFVIGRKSGAATQNRLIAIMSWSSGIIVALALALATAYVKLGYA